MGDARVAVFLTAYNEGRVIGDVIDGIDCSYDVYVIDDGSEDDTAQVARERGAVVITHPVNLGQGASVITMFKLASTLDYDYIIHMDADGQHDPAEIPKFIRKFGETGADVVQGSRLLGQANEDAPWGRMLFLKPLTHVLNKLTGYELSDSMCGFRGHSVESLRRVVGLFDEMTETQYLAAEIWIKFANAGLKVVNVPITLADRRHGFSYKGIIFRYGIGILLAIVRSTLDVQKHKYRDMRPKDKGGVSG
jgi:glycosyltransferase involved in cell wall biosynthesis